MLKSERTLQRIPGGSRARQGSVEERASRRLRPAHVSLAFVLTTLACLTNHPSLAAAQTTENTASPSPPPPAQAAPEVTTVPAVAVGIPAPPPGYVLVPIGTPAPVAPLPAEETKEPPKDLPYRDGQPVPPGFHVEERLRRGLVIGGSLTLGIPWVFSATTAVGNDFEDQSGFLMIPALGPWLMLAAGGASEENCLKDEFDADLCETRMATQRALLFLDGVAQTAGAVMLAVGLAYPTKRLIRNDVSVSFAPTPLGRDGYGLGAVGTF